MNAYVRTKEVGEKRIIVKQKKKRIMDSSHANACEPSCSLRKQSRLPPVRSGSFLAVLGMGNPGRLAPASRVDSKKDEKTQVGLETAARWGFCSG